MNTQKIESFPNLTLHVRLHRVGTMRAFASVCKRLQAFANVCERLRACVLCTPTFYIRNAGEFLFSA